MRQTNIMFASILTKIGNGSILNVDELAIIESRIFMKEEVLQLVFDYSMKMHLLMNTIKTFYNKLRIDWNQSQWTLFLAAKITNKKHL